MLPRFGIRGKLFSSILLILLISYSTLIYITVKRLYASLDEDINQELETNLRYVQGQYLNRADTIKFSIMQTAASAAFQEHLQSGDRIWLRNALQLCYKNLPVIDFLTVVDRENRVIARGFSGLTGDVFDLGPVVTRALQLKQPTVSTELANYGLLCREGKTSYCNLSARGEAMVVAVAVPIISQGNVLLGAIVSGDILNESPHLPFKMQQIVGKEVEVNITQGGESITSTHPGEVPFRASVSPEVIDILRAGRHYRGMAEIGGKPCETVFEPIRNIKGEFIGSLSVALSRENVNRIRRENLRNIIASAMVGIFLSFGLAFVVARRLTGPLRELTSGVRMIETGELTRRVAIDQRDEVGLLARSFNSMADTLLERDRIIRENTRELQRLNEQLERKVVERTTELRIGMGRLEAILTSMAEGVVVTDHDNRVILCNPAAQKIFDLVPHRILNQQIEDLCDSGEYCILVDYIKKVRETDGQTSIREGEFHARGKKLKINISPLLDEAGVFEGVVMSFRDATMEEEVDRMKTEFISTVSHELKTPLTSMKGSLQYIMTKGKWLTEMERELLLVCMRNTDRLIRLINDILDISKIEAGKVDFSLKPQNIQELSNYAVEEISGFAMNRNVSIENEVGAALPMVYGDYDRLIQVLTNLLSNAVKFSPEGKNVLVSARRDGNYVAVSVADQGKAIQWSDRDKLFRKFQQLHAVGAVAGGGTGLGLAICKEIIERHHGRIYYQESDDGGNVFTFTVPVFEES
ncbi:MAG TPA: ATP-binding protein [Geobacteraceae bacterium]|nr:ATP-binding protein [Geobacteraceae bacterium]